MADRAWHRPKGGSAECLGHSLIVAMRPEQDRRVLSEQKNARKSTPPFDPGRIRTPGITIKIPLRVLIPEALDLRAPFHCSARYDCRSAKSEDYPHKLPRIPLSDEGRHHQRHERRTLRTGYRRGIRAAGKKVTSCSVVSGSSSPMRHA